MPTSLSEKEAAHGQKMIEVKVRFWTNDIAEESNKIIPKECWDSGVLRLEPNKIHGIKASPIPFNSLMELPSKIEEALFTSGIKMHHGNKSRKYFKCG